MSLLSNIILEEAQRNLLMCEQYEMELSKLPKGTIVVKKVGVHEYYCLKYRNAKKVVTDYLGCDSKKLEQVRQQLEKRQHFEIMLDELQKEQKLLRRIMEES